MKDNMMIRDILKRYMLPCAATIAIGGLVACEKVSPAGVLLGVSGTDDRVKMSLVYYQTYLEEAIDGETDGDYSFIVGSDSHVTTDTCRMAEMLQIGLDNDDMFYAHLGDIADTKAQYYIRLDHTLKTFKQKYVAKNFNYDSETKEYIDPDTGRRLTFDDIIYPFFPVVGNHDITHNGWSLYTSIFHSSFYEFTIKIGDTGQYDRFIFLDSANGTLGSFQIDVIDQGVFDTDKPIRNTFVFTHSNLFRPSSNQFASTFPREELYYMLNKFMQWNCSIVFCGHVHAWDDREFGGVRYLTLESMSERNSPTPGDYLVRVNCKKDGTVTYERVHMNYTAGK